MCPNYPHEGVHSTYGDPPGSASGLCFVSGQVVLHSCVEEDGHARCSACKCQSLRNIVAAADLSRGLDFMQGSGVSFVCTTNINWSPPAPSATASVRTGWSKK